MNGEILPDQRPVVIIGASGALGRRVVADLERTSVAVRAFDSLPAEPAALAAACEGAATVVQLAFDAGTEWRPAATEFTNVEGMSRLLDAAATAGVAHLVIVSSAMVYGAWPNNPVPLTEDAALRPNPEFGYAVQHATIEHLALQWLALGRTVTTLRPVVSMSNDHDGGWIARALAGAAGARLRESDPPAQFLHLDDLSSAVTLAVAKRLDGAFNVAPDGWILGATTQALAGRTTRLRLPTGVAHRIAVWRWEFQQGPIPPGLLAYTVHPWVVANDRLRDAGWLPKRTNEQAFVSGTEAKWWTLLSPKRKQELALGGTIGLGAVVAAIATGVARRSIRRRGYGR